MQHWTVAWSIVTAMASSSSGGGSGETGSSHPPRAPPAASPSIFSTVGAVIVDLSTPLPEETVPPPPGQQCG